MSSCDYLPEMILLSEFNGNWQECCEKLYSEFKRDFIDSKPQYENKIVDIIHHQIFDGKERSFWHIITEGEHDSDREPDMRRCEKITHIRPLIEHTPNSCPNYLVWKKFHDKNSKDRIYIWCISDNYLVIIEDRKSHYKLITAFVVKDFNVDYYKKEYNKYKQ